MKQFGVCDGYIVIYSPRCTSEVDVQALTRRGRVGRPRSPEVAWQLFQHAPEWSLLTSRHGQQQSARGQKPGLSTRQERQATRSGQQQTNCGQRPWPRIRQERRAALGIFPGLEAEEQSPRKGTKGRAATVTSPRRGSKRAVTPQDLWGEGSAVTLPRGGAVGRAVTPVPLPGMEDKAGKVTSPCGDGAGKAGNPLAPKPGQVTCPPGAAVGKEVALAPRTRTGEEGVCSPVMSPRVAGGDSTVEAASPRVAGGDSMVKAASPPVGGSTEAVKAASQRVAGGIKTGKSASQLVGIGKPVEAASPRAGCSVNTAKPAGRSLGETGNTGPKRVIGAGASKVGSPRQGTLVMDEATKPAKPGKPPLPGSRGSSAGRSPTPSSSQLSEAAKRRVVPPPVTLGTSRSTLAGPPLKRVKVTPGPSGLGQGGSPPGSTNTPDSFPPKVAIP
jgi:hypothetical protein